MLILYAVSYAKLFSSITESSLWGSAHHVRILFVSMLAKADATGFVEAAMTGLSRIANLSLDETSAAVASLEGPDPDSKNPDNDGRRIAKVPGGWMILNYETYRNRPGDDERREYMRRYMKEYRSKQRVNSGKQSLAPVSDGEHRLIQAEAEAEAEAEVHLERDLVADLDNSVAKRSSDAALEIYQAYPRKVAKQHALKAIKAAMKDEPPEKLLERTKAYAAATETWVVADKKFIPHPSTWFNQGRYDDDPETWKRNGEDTKANRSQDRESPRNIGTLNEGISERYSNENLRALGKI